MQYRILSLDGGGIRGVYTATLLSRLCEHFPNLFENVQLMAGTSTGAILALALASGKSAQALLGLYREFGRFVFDDSILDNIRDLGHTVGAQYDGTALLTLLREQFGEHTLGDLQTKVLIPTFDLQAPPKEMRPCMWKPKFFHNYPGADSDAHERIVDVAMRTTAAPTYFPVYQGYIDGGIVANNPSMAALAQALHPTTGGQTLSSVRLLSVGTGISIRNVPGENLDWGLLQWAPQLVQLMMDGAMGVADYQCNQLLGEHYHRLNALLHGDVALDDIDQVEYLIELAQHMPLEPTLEWVAQHFI